MIIRLLLLVVLLLLAVSVGTILQQDPGYVWISIHNWTIETTLCAAICVLLLLLFCVNLLLTICGRIYHIPKYWNDWYNKSQKIRADVATKRGLLAFYQGNWQAAKKYLIKALPHTETPLLNYLTAAQSAQELGDNVLRDQYLRLAQQSIPKEILAVELTQAKLQIDKKQWEQALATLQHLQKLAPKHPYVIKLLVQVYQTTKEWQQLLKLIPLIKDYKILTKDDLFDLTQLTYIKILEDYIKAADVDNINKYMEQLPTELTYNIQINTIYLTYLFKEKEYAKAETLLNKCLKKQVTPEWLHFYGKLPLPYASLVVLKPYLKSPHLSAAMELCLARIYVKQQLWGQALVHFKACINIEATPQHYLELAQLCEKLNNHDEAYNYYKLGLSLI